MRKPRSVRKIRNVRRAGPRAVDEEVGEPVARPRPDSRLGARAEPEQRALRAPRCRLRSRRRRGRRARSAGPRPRRRAARAAGRSCSARRLRALVEAGAVERRARGRSCAKRSAGSPSAASITCRSRRARSRWARNSWPSPIPSLAPSIRPGHVGDGELAAVRRLDRAEHRRERRERIVGDLRLARSRCRRSSDDLPAFGRPTHRRVGEQLQPELERRLLAGQARLGEARRLPRRASRSGGCRGRRAPPRASDHARARMREVGDQLALVVEDLRPDRNVELDVSPSAPCLPEPRPCRRGRLEASCASGTTDRSRRSGSATSTTSPPRPPSPPSGPPFGTYFSRRKLERAVAAAAGLHLDAGAIVEHRRRSLARRLDDGRRSGARRSCGTRPCRRASRRSCRRGRCRARAGAEPRAALADDDHAGLDLLAGEDLHAEPLGVRVAPVASRSRDLSCEPLVVSFVFCARCALALPCACSCSAPRAARPLLGRPSRRPSAAAYPAALRWASRPLASAISALRRRLAPIDSISICGAARKPVCFL